MTEKSKILFVVTQSEWGGAQRYIFDLANNLPIEQYEIAVAVGNEKTSEKNLLNKLDEKNLKSYTLKHLVREISPLADLKAYWELKKIIKDFKPDILHLNSSKAGVVGAIAGRHAKVKKIIYTVHGFVFNEPLAMWKRLIYLWTEKLGAHFKDKLICVSDYDRQTGIRNKIASPQKFITIHNGLSPVELMSKIEARSELNLPPNKKILGTIANFYPTKDLKTLIQAFNIVHQKKPETVLAIIGDGQLRPELEATITDLKLNNKVVLLGEKQQASQYLPAFDIYTCSSVKEGLPYSIIEAMKAGLPIVSTDVGGIPEIITDNQSGLLVKPGNPNDLASAIINLLEDQNLAQQLAEQAKANLATKFSLAQMIAQTKEIYQS